MMMRDQHRQARGCKQVSVDQTATFPQQQVGFQAPEVDSELKRRKEKSRILKYLSINCELTKNQSGELRYNLSSITENKICTFIYCLSDSCPLHPPHKSRWTLVSVAQGPEVPPAWPYTPLPQPGFPVQTPVAFGHQWHPRILFCGSCGAHCRQHVWPLL